MAILPLDKAVRFDPAKVASRMKALDLLTQKALIKKAEIDQSLASRAMRGEKISVENADKIAKSLGSTIDELRAGESSAPIVEPIDLHGLDDPESDRLAKAVFRIGTEGFPSYSAIDIRIAADVITKVSRQLRGKIHENILASLLLEAVSVERSESPQSVPTVEQIAIRALALKCEVMPTGPSGSSVESRQKKEASIKRSRV